MSTTPWWSKGIPFECQGSGRCCVSRGEYGFVYLSKQDRPRLAKFFRLSTAEFLARFCKKDPGGWVLRSRKRACIFLKDKQCSVYEARPTQCRTWPFWPENMGAKTWSRDVVKFCPGVGKGKVWTEAEIRKQLKLQEKSEENP